MLESITNEQLALQAQSGDKRALEQLWMQCKPFITGICKRYTREPMFPPAFDASGNITGVSPDLLNESFLVMTDCVKDYSPDCGYGFLTHLKNRIEWRFLGLVQEQSLVRVPAYMVALKRKYNRLMDDCYKKTGNYPTDIEACEMLQIDHRQLDQIKGVNLPLIYLDKPIGGSGDPDDDLFILDTLEDEQAAAEIDDCVTALYNSELWLSLGRVLKSRELDILQQRYQQGLSLEQIATKQGITKERIRQIIDTSLTKIRTNGLCTKELMIDGNTANRGYYLGGFGHYRNHLFTSSTERQAIHNTEGFFKRKQRQRLDSVEDIDQLEQELISVFGDAI